MNAGVLPAQLGVIHNVSTIGGLGHGVSRSMPLVQKNHC